MLRLDLQFYAFFMVALAGAVLGLLFDLLRVMRGYFQPNRWLGAAADLLFWTVATAALAGSLFYGNWGELRFYVLVAILTGLGLYYWLASPFVTDVARLVLRLLEWLLTSLAAVLLRLVWAPLMALVDLVSGALRFIWRWTTALGLFIGEALVHAAVWLATPVTGPYRCLRLHYLLTKRRLKRRLRHWLFGPPAERKR